MSEPANANSSATERAAELRRSERVQVDISVQIFSAQMTCYGRGHELGRLGMAVHVPIDLKEGESIRLMFQPPESKARFGLVGVVRNRENFRYGIEFRELGRAEASELDRVVTSIHNKNIVAS